MTIDHAIIPAAGFGTRLRPLTLAIPKEMLPLGRRPVLEHVVEEVRAAGIRHILFVVSPGKEMIERYFDNGSRWGVECEYLTQPQMKGLGDAILLAKDWAGGRPSLVAFGDCVIDSAVGIPSAQLANCHTRNGSDATVLTQRVPRRNSGKYGIMKPAAGSSTESPFLLEDIVEKPSPEEAPSELAVAGRWVLGARVYDLLRRTPHAANGELNLTDAIRLGIGEGLRVWAVPLREGEARRDIGGWETYLTAAADYAMRDEEFGDAVRRSLCR